MALQSVLSSNHHQKKFTPEEINASLPEAIEWYTKIGAFSENSTLNQSKKKYETAKPILKGAHPDTAALQAESLYHAIENIHSYIRIFRAFSRLDQNHLPKKRLREALTTPLLPREEVSGSANVNPRNALFELEFAAEIIDAGLKVTGFDDLIFEIDRTRIVVECKRLHSEKNIAENCRKAKQQIHTRFESIKDRGLVVISYDKPYQVDDKILLALDEDEAYRRNQRLFNSFYERNRPHFSVFKRARIFGIFFIFKTNNLLKSDFLIGPSYYRSFVQMVPDTQSHEYERQLCESFFKILTPI